MLDGWGEIFSDKRICIVVTARSLGETTRSSLARGVVLGARKAVDADSDADLLCSRGSFC